MSTGRPVPRKAPWPNCSSAQARNSIPNWSGCSPNSTGTTRQLAQRVATRWLRSLDPDLVNSYWSLNTVPSPRCRAAKTGSLFEAKLLENMYDAVVFVDAAGRIVLWNHGAERLTGIAGSGIRRQIWHPGQCSK